MLIGGTYKVFEKVYTDEHFDYLKLYLTTPFAWGGTETDGAYDAGTKSFKFQASTHLSFGKSDCH